MSSYKIDCPFCGQRIEVPDELNNTTANCPACNQELYLTSDDAVEDLDPVVEQIRRQTAAADKSHREELRQVMMAQEQARQSRESSRRVLNILLWVFVYWPLIGAAVIWIIYGLFSWVSR